MLNKLLKRLSPGRPNIIKPSTHKIDNQEISKAALNVVSKLQQADHAAFLVGGCIRDILLGNHPKDFDVATDATPEQAQELFRKARIIGKRFRIVHVIQGRETIEVTTFRGHHENSDKSGEAAQSDKGILLRDNVYGDIESDALRRDFTVNAFYYNPTNGELFDYTDGIQDLNDRQLRVIGDANARYKEDPVRMLRALRFAAKLGFTITEESRIPIYEHNDYLAEIPSARLFEEVLKLFMNGYGTPTLSLLRDYDFLKYLFPAADSYLTDEEGIDSRFIQTAIINTDKRIRRNQRVTPAFIYAAMLWPALRQATFTIKEEQQLSAHDAMQQASIGVISQQLQHTAIPKRFLIPMKEIWFLQQRFGNRVGNRPYQLMEHKRFRAAYDFLLLREEAGEKTHDLGQWWTKFQHANDTERADMLRKIRPNRRRRPNKKRESRGE